MRLLTRTLLSALIIKFAFPAVPGLGFDGDYLAAILPAVIFAAILYLVETLCFGLAAFMTVASLGLAAIVIIPIWLLGFWLLPALALYLTTYIFPDLLLVKEPIASTYGGALLLGAMLLTSKLFWKKRSR